MTSRVLACDLRYTLENRGVLPIRAMLMGEPNG